MQLPIYLDYAASTPLDERVANAMMPYLFGKKCIGNPSSSTHSFGRTSLKAIDNARQQVANLINAEVEQIIWTSGATESNNLAIKGVLSACKAQSNHLITLMTEHKSVLDSCRTMEQQGVEVTYLRPKSDGLIELATIEKAVRPNTKLITIMHVNNETGIIQNIEEIAKFAATRNILLHVDAAQSIGKFPIDVAMFPVDLLSLSAHKIYGPKGIGALFIRNPKQLAIEPLLSGGGQELGLRAGTLATHQIVGMGAAYQIAQHQLSNDSAHVITLRQRFLAQINSLKEVHINSHSVHTYAGILNISFKYLDSKRIVEAVTDLAFSIGSACVSSSLEPYYVLRALGIDSQIARAAIRLSFGRFTTIEEIDYAAAQFNSFIPQLRAAVPMWQALNDQSPIKV